MAALHPHESASFPFPGPINPLLEDFGYLLDHELLHLRRHPDAAWTHTATAAG
jgi:hypothetical protein